MNPPPKLFLCAIICLLTANVQGLENCPMNEAQYEIRNIVAQHLGYGNLQKMQIKTRMEQLYGGQWGVVIIQNPNQVGVDIHWIIPDVYHGGKQAFCATVFGGWQYNVFMTNPNRPFSRAKRLTDALLNAS